MADLFSPITIKQVTFPNRLVMPPMVRMTEQTPEDSTPPGTVTPAVVEHYASRVRAGTGLIIVEATAVDLQGRCWEGGLNLLTTTDAANLSRIAAGIRAAGGRSCIQLVHGGPQAAPDLCGGVTFGPSAVRHAEGAQVPQELTVAQILAIQERFAQAAERAIAAGFDAIELHAAHGYLLDSFLQQRRNQRTDAYGKDAAGRMRMLVETCQLTRQRIGNNGLICCRISPFTRRDEGITLDDMSVLVRALDAAGIDILHLSTDGAFKGWFGTEKTLGHYVREMTSLPLIIAGGMRKPADAQRLVAENHADFAAVGWAMLQDADWAAKAREELR